MYIRKLATLSLALVLSVACGNGVDLSEAGSSGASGAAEYFYDLLAKGDGRAYVENMHDAYEMDSCKKVQMIALMDQFLAEEQSLRGGILSAKATGDSLLDTTAVVFMDVLFGDTTSEAVILPLVYTRGRWWVK